MGQHNIIELNGKQYDALTGALLGESRIAATPETKRTHLKRQGRNMDGFIRKSTPANSLKPVVVKPVSKPASSPDSSYAVTAAAHIKAVRAATAKASPSVNAVSMGGVKRPAARRPVKQLAHHHPEKPKTLMRRVVKKPKTEMKPAIKTTLPTEMMARPMSTLAKPLEKKLSVTKVNPVRLGRARHVAKSHHIRRFHENRMENRGLQQIATPAAGVSAARQIEQARPTQEQTRSTQYDARPVGGQATTRQSATSKQAVTQQAVGRQDATDIFEAALAHATSHEQKSPVLAGRRHARRRRLINVMAGLGAFLVIAGFIAYLNKPAIELRVASMRAGFHAQMPSYKPTGYALEGGVKSSDGKVAMQFRSGDNSYWITQEASDWNSSTLLDQSAEKRGAPSRTIQSKGRTIYIYNDSAATWVNGGVRYEISGSSSLDAGELVSLATSM